MKRHWFHCTQDDHGESWTPKLVCPAGIGAKEPRVPRLCVSKSIAACFVARLFVKDGPVHVYRTSSPRRGIKPFKVFDMVITGERWILPPVEMVQYATISNDERQHAQYWLREALYATCRSRVALNIREKIAAYSEAVEALADKGPPYVTGFDRRFCASLRKSWDVVDWRQVFVERVEKYAC